jgi:ABC-2 type transport system permease protein
MRTLMTNELLKLRTIRSPWLILAAAQLTLVLGVSGLLANADPGDAGLMREAVAHVGLVALFPLVLGIMSVAGEYRHGTVADTYLTTPRRDRVVLAKLAVQTVVGLCFGILGSVTAVVAALVWLSARGGDTTIDSSVWQTLAGGTVWNAAFAAVGLAVGALVRNLTGAIAAALAWLALIEGLVGQLIGDLGKWLPFAAGRALGQLPGDGGTLLEPWQGGVVLAAYAVVLALAGLAATTRADVT